MGRLAALVDPAGLDPDVLSGRPERDGLDLRLVPAAAGAWGGAYLAGAVGPDVAVRLGLAAAGGCALLALRRLLARRRAGPGGCPPRPPGNGARPPARVLPAPVCVAVLAALAGGLLAEAARQDSRASGPVPALAAAETSVSARLVVVDDPRMRPGRQPTVVVRARLEQVRAAGRAWRVRHPVLVLAPADRWRALLPSQKVLADGRLVPARSGDLAAVLLVRGPPEQVGAPSALQRVAGRVREGLRAATTGLSPEGRALLPGLVIGDTSAMPEDLVDDFRASGLSHLTAVSGANCAIVVAVVMVLVRRLPVGPRGRSALAAAALLCFVVLVRPSPSVLRAGLMALVVLLALALGRPRSAMPALAGTVLLLVLLDPGLARQPGFVLSVLATAGLLVLAPGWREALARRMPGPLADLVAVTLAAEVACTPVVAGLTGTVGVVSVVANVLAVPVVPVVTVLGVLVALAAVPAPPVAVAVAHLADLPCRWLAGVARTTAALPGARLGWPSGVVGLLLAGLCVVLLVAALRRPAPRRAVLAVGCAVTVAALGIAPAVVTQWPPDGWRVVMCDVGQGDAIVLRDPGGAAVLVDAGPDPDLVAGCLRRLDVRRLAAVVLSHLHADHAEGVAGVLGRMPVGRVVVGPLTDPVEQDRQVRRRAAAAGVPVESVAAGTAWQTGGLRLDVVGPVAVLHGTASDPNNASLVLVATFAGSGGRPGLRVLLPGDVEPEAQRLLLGRVPAVDVLKVPHHGSGRQEPRFIAETRARVALVPVGRDNDYGHPAATALDLLRRAGMRTFRTDEQAGLAVTGLADRLAVVPQLPRRRPMHDDRPAALAPPRPPNRPGPANRGAHDPDDRSRRAPPRRGDVRR